MANLWECRQNCWLPPVAAEWILHWIILHDIHVDTQCSEHYDESVALPAATGWGASRSLFKGSERDKKAPAALKFRKKK